MMSLETRDFLRLIKNKMGIIILFGLIVSLISFYAFIFTQKRYETTTDYLIVQDQMGTQDFYSLSKSAEYLGGVLSEAVYSSVFINELKNTNKISPAYFPLDERESQKKWKKAVEIEKSPNLGIMKVRVYDNNREVAIGISQGISEIMVTKNYLFRGKVNLDVRVLSGPVTEKNPSIGKILLVVAGGFVLGGALKLIHIYYTFVMMMFKREEREEYLNSLKEMK
ncbi:MAG: hypothetical protein ACD_7C00089G0004 [uncultured bacterium]|nr:MAG: hypothetical protein ACD_7C00089G0004 [uncultured bacterium]HBR79542.1 hypothetical protein [Candidatus Moranbacteria bacterium]